jgi:predicted dehydrogenase
MINTAIVGLGWWGKTLVKAARDFGAPLRFVRGVTLEPDAVREFAAEHKMVLGTSLDDVLADESIQAAILATPHTKHPAQVQALAPANTFIAKSPSRSAKRTPSPCWKRASVPAL